MPLSTATHAGSDRTAPWPAVVRAALAQRRQELLADTTGVVVDLADERAAASVWRAGSSLAAAGGPTTGECPAGTADTIVSVGALAAFADLPAALASVAQLLTPDGQLLFIEPVGVPGWRGLLQSSAGSLLGPTKGWQLGRDVPAALRAGGLLVDRIERFVVPTAVWPLRHFVQGCALRGIPADDADTRPDNTTQSRSRPS